MKVKAETLKCAAFLGIEVDGKFGPAGTGFFVGVPYEHDKTRQHTYLVTAKHNIDPKRGNCNAFRVNTKDGKSKVVRFSASQVWYDHLTETVDACLCPIGIEEDWDILVLPFEMITPAGMLGNDQCGTRKSPRRICFGGESIRTIRYLS